MSSNAPPKGLSGKRCVTSRKRAAKETNVLGFFPEIMAAKEKKLALRDQWKSASNSVPFNKKLGFQLLLDMKL